VVTPQPIANRLLVHYAKPFCGGILYLGEEMPKKCELLKIKYIAFLYINLLNS
jgi:hypothetical protein